MAVRSSLPIHCIYQAVVCSLGAMTLHEYKLEIAHKRCRIINGGTEVHNGKSWLAPTVFAWHCSIEERYFEDGKHGKAIRNNASNKITLRCKWDCLLSSNTQSCCTYFWSRRVFRDEFHVFRQEVMGRWPAIFRCSHSSIKWRHVAAFDVK